MSLFVATLALADPAVRRSAKLAIILGCLLFAVAGTGWPYQSRRASRAAAQQG